MRLIDFNRSTIDLHPALQLFWEHDHVTTPIVDILPATHQRILLRSGAGQPLTLDQLRTRCQQADPHANLFMAATTPIRLYGYRLVPHQILLG
ncbi:hypothetical protein [Levilactobacillus angrenensis]|uniref:Uncharacterized protein n=1 Tax=Levilactobacillus angrenensis TaxID=2486020 RepID=A0ABW1U7V6_9LACO|nr:hypothetical protein [Levilactobacillus angrenensis]